MKTVNISKIATQLNAHAESHPIGRLPEIRMRLKGLSKRPGSTVFQRSTTNAEWAFHYGGRKELQSNIGTDATGGKMLRHGVAFSLETSQSLPDISPLVPKVELFGEYLQQHPAEFRGMKMWHFEGNARSNDSKPGPIPKDLVRPGIFVFLGKLQPAEAVNYEIMLKDFDRLLPLYTFVESNGARESDGSPVGLCFSFRPGCSTKSSTVIRQLKRDPTNVNLRHNALQAKLYERLAAKCGASNVGAERGSGLGTRIDLVLKHGNDFSYSYSARRAVLGLDPTGPFEYHFTQYEYDRSMINEGIGKGASPWTGMIEH